MSADDPEEKDVERVDKMYDLAKRKVKHYDMAFCMMDILGFRPMLLQNPNAKLRFFYEKVIPLLETGILEGEWAADLMPAMNSCSKSYFSTPIVKDMLLTGPC